MRSMKLTVLLIVLGANANSFVLAQSLTEVRASFARLQHSATSDKAYVHLRALAETNSEVRRYLGEQIPNLILQTTPPVWFNPVWRNSVHLAGDLRIPEAVPILVKALDSENCGGPSTMTSRDRLDDDPPGKALAQIGAQAIEPVRSVLENNEKSQQTRMRAALVLYNMHSPEADAALRHDLETEHDPRVRLVIEARLKPRSAPSPH